MSLEKIYTFYLMVLIVIALSSHNPLTIQLTTLPNLWLNLCTLWKMRCDTVK